MAEIELQAALYSRINGAGIGANVYDVPPQSLSDYSDSLELENGTGLTLENGGSIDFGFFAFPYITFGRVIMTALDTQTKNGFSALIRIHTFSRTSAMKECKVLQGRLYDAMHHTVLTVSGHNNFFLSREATDCMVDADGKIHGVCEYRALIERA